MSDSSDMYRECLRTHVDRMFRIHPERMNQLAEHSGLQLSEGGGNNAASAQDVVRYLDAVRQIFGTVNLMAAKAGIDQLLQTHEQTVLEQAKRLERLEQSLNESAALIRNSEENERKYRTLFDSATEGIFLLSDVFEECNERACRLWACTREDILGHCLVDFSPPYQPDGRGSPERAKELVEAALSGRPQSFYWQNQRKDGVLVDAEMSLEPIVVGGQTKILASVHDITERKRAEADLGQKTAAVLILQEIAVASNEGPDFETVLQFAIDQVCGYTGWPVGHVYLRSETEKDLLVPSPIWYLASAEQFETFRSVTQKTTFERGVGLPGRVLSHGRPAWIKDVTKDTNFPRAQLAKDIGVRAAFGFPVLVGEEVAAVLEFFSTEAMRPDEPLLELMHHIGTQLGRVAERNAMEESLANERKKLERTVEARTAELRKSLRQLKDTNLQLNAILDNIDDGIIVVDDDGYFLVANPAAREMFDSEGKEDTVDDWAARQEFCQSDGTTPCPHDEFPLRVALNGNVVRDEEMFLPRDGGTWLSVSARPWAEELAGLRGAIAVFHDLTKRKKNELELREARRLADQASTAKSQFLANMSHELRTPLNAIIGFSQIVLEDAQEAGLDEVASDQKKILKAGNQLLDLINDILDLSKIEAGKVEIYVESFNTSTMINDVVVTVQPLVEKNQNTLEVHEGEDLGTMNSDLTKIRQCLFNLLSNSCKFTEKGVVTLDVRRYKATDGDRMVFSVHDQGIGMSQEQLNKVFDVFMQADASTTKKYGGTGLGLAISQRIAKMLGGEITVESKLGEGSTFQLHVLADLPCAKVRSQATAAIPAEMPRRSGSDITSRAENTILIIDDELVVRELIQRLVEKDGFQSVGVESGEEGLELARQMKPFAITLDVLMPGMDGWAVLTKLKADPDLEEIPVIIISIMDEKNLGYSLGASDYLIKPVDSTQLSRVLDRYRSQLVSAPVLVVDDDADTREMVRRMLDKTDTKMVEAENGIVALEQLAIHRPALVLLDLMMPEMNGFEFLEALSKLSDYRDIPVVVLTSKSLTNEDRERLSGQVEGVIEKGSVSTGELLAYLQRKLEELRRRSSVAE